MKICFTLNGQERTLETPPDRRAIDLLRYDLGCTGTKESCGSGECGSCSILVDGEQKLSCLMLAGLHNRETLAEAVEIEETIEHSFKKDLSLAEIQAALEAGELPPDKIDVFNAQM